MTAIKNEVKKRKIYNIYMESRKVVQMILSAKQKWIHKHREKMYRHQRRQGGGMNWETEIGAVHVHYGYCV